jgi:hypothetical protein
MKRGALLLMAIAVVVVVYSCDGGAEPQANRPPKAVGSIPAQEVAATDTARVDLSSYFDDPDGDQLTYNALSYDRTVADASVAGATLLVLAKTRGKTVMLVNAIDPDGLKASQNMDVTVLGKPGFLRVELSYDEEEIGAVVLEIEGPASDSVEAGAGLEVYHLPVSGGMHAFVVGAIADTGTVFRFWAEDVTAPGDYRGRLDEAAGKDYRQRPVGSGKVVIAK